MDEIKAKQQVVEKIKASSKILITVSNDPSLDALSAALGLALLLDTQEKYATAIYSGQTPQAMAFLQPEKTFDNTTDSLRDFIIALNKEKADHLRYKVDGDAVKIFITPYKTTITQDDLEFSQGDYNVELVIALGVDNPDHLDAALENHGQILHDAAIITMTTGNITSSLGGIDWHDSQSSSLSEMVAGLAEALKTDKNKTLLNESIATALLTGIVAETDRFSNERTTSRVMTLAAQLMAAGADQQLISTELQKSHTILNDPQGAPDAAMTSDKATDSHPGDSLSISHADQSASNVPVSAVPAVSNAYTLETDSDEPSLGGTLNATTDQAADDARREAESAQNTTILSHAYLSSTPPDATTPASSETPGFPGSPPVAPGSTTVNDAPVGEVSSAYAFDEPQVPEVTETNPPIAQPVADAPQPLVEPEQPAMGGERVIQPLGSQPVAVPPIAPSPVDLGLPLPPPLPDFSQGVAPPTPAIPLPQTPQPPILGDILTQDTPPTVQQPFIQPVTQDIPQPQAPADPTQFTIPGQQ